MSADDVEMFPQMSDDELLYCLKINDISVRFQANSTSKERRIIMYPEKLPPFWKLLEEDRSLKSTQNTETIMLIKDFIHHYKFYQKSPREIWDNFELMFSREFVEFCRKPGRMSHDQMTSTHRIWMYLDDRYFVGEDIQKAAAVKQCMMNIYPSWLKIKDRPIDKLKKFFEREPTEPDAMKMALVNTQEALRKSKKYIELADVLLIDLEGDQLGPNGVITLIQINTYENSNCFLIDIKECGDHELRHETGWLRSMFEDGSKVKILWGGQSDAANLYASFGIEIDSFLDLQIVEFHNRPILSKFSNGMIEPDDRRNVLALEKAYKFFTEAPLLKYKADQGKHKTDYHVWAHRPIPRNLLEYASFDVASLRPIAHIFFNQLQLWNWGTLEGALSRSRLISWPKARTCFTCLVTQTVNNFSKSQQKSLSSCRFCINQDYIDEYPTERIVEWPENDQNRIPSITQLDRNPRIALSEAAHQPLDYNPNVTVLQRLGIGSG